MLITIRNTSETISNEKKIHEDKTAVIIGSCSMTILIIIFLSIFVWKYRSAKKRRERSHHKSTYMLNRPHDIEEGITYDTIEDEEGYDPDIYVNTRNELV